MGLAFPSLLLERGVRAWQGAAFLSGLGYAVLSVPKIQSHVGDAPAPAPARCPGMSPAAGISGSRLSSGNRDLCQ